MVRFDYLSGDELSVWLCWREICDCILLVGLWDWKQPLPSCVGLCRCIPWHQKHDLHSFAGLSQDFHRILCRAVPSHSSSVSRQKRLSCLFKSETETFAICGSQTFKSLRGGVVHTANTALALHKGGYLMPLWVSFPSRPASCSFLWS